MDSRLLWGMLDMLVLDVISRGPTYGYQIAQTVLAQSKGYFDLKEVACIPPCIAWSGKSCSRHIGKRWRSVAANSTN